MKKMTKVALTLISVVLFVSLVAAYIADPQADDVASAVTKVFRSSPESPELERASKAYIALKFKQLEERIVREVREENNPFYRIKGPIRVHYIKYDVEKTPAETLRYHVIMKLRATKVHDAKGTTTEDIAYYTVIATRKPIIAADGTVSYSKEFDTFKWHVAFDDMKARNKLAALEKKYFR